VERVRNGIPQLADRVLSRSQDSPDKGKKRSISRAFKLADFLLRLPYYFFPGPFVYFVPMFAGHMICTKRIKPQEQA
jgi:hypothetical protein